MIFWQLGENCVSAWHSMQALRRNRIATAAVAAYFCYLSMCRNSSEISELFGCLALYNCFRLLAACMPSSSRYLLIVRRAI